MKHQTLIIPTILLLAMIGFFQWLNPNFLSQYNITVILEDTFTVLVVALGVTFVIMMGCIDLSVGGVIALIDILIPFVLMPYFGSYGSLLLGLGIGAAIGTINGVFLTKVKVPSFLATMSMMFICSGLAWEICRGWGLSFYDPLFNWISREHLIPIASNLVLLGALVFVLCVIVASRTSFGRKIYAVGGAEYVARLSGVNADTIKIAVFAISGFFAALTGILLLGRVGVASIYVGDRYLLDSISAACLGGTTLTGGAGGPHRTILGALFMAVLSSGMNIIALDPFAQILIKGIFLIACVSLTLDRTKIRVAK